MPKTRFIKQDCTMCLDLGADQNEVYWNHSRLWSTAHFLIRLLFWFAAWGKTNEIQSTSQTNVPLYFLTKTMLDHDHRRIPAVTRHHSIFYTRNWFAWTVGAKLRVCPKISRSTANRDFSFSSCSMFKRFFRSLLLRHAHILRCEVATLSLGVGRILEVSDIPPSEFTQIKPGRPHGILVEQGHHLSVESCVDQVISKD